MKISFVIPTYSDKGIALTRQCLESMRKFYPDNEIIVVEDGSNAKVQEFIQNICSYYGAKLLRNYRNLGFSHSVNRGIEQANGDIVVLTNNDIIFTNTLDLSMFDLDPQLGMMGFLLYYPNGNIQHGGFLRFPKTINFGHYDHNYPSKQAKQSFISKYSVGVTGALQAIRKTMTNSIGIYSTKYMNCYEDVEFCLRAWHNKWHVWYNSKSSAIHNEGDTRGRTELEKKKLKTWESELTSLIQFHRDLESFNIEDIEAYIKTVNDNIPKNKKIGLIRTWALGDAILATGIIDKLKKDNPSADICFCVDKQFVGVFENNTSISKIFTDIPRLQAFCDEVIDLTLVYENDPKKPIWTAYADYVFGTSYIEEEIMPKMYSEGKNMLHVIDRLKNGQISVENIIVVHAPKSWESRTLPYNVWLDVIDELKKRGFTILIVGTDKDYHFPCDGVYNLHNQFTIPQLRELMKISSFFIGTDSSLIHIAQTTNVQSIGIFSCVNPEYRVFNKKTRVVIPNDDCKFCLSEVERTIKLECKHGDNRCINSIKAQDILKEVY